MAINIFGGHYTISQIITNPAVNISHLHVAASAAKPFALINAAIEPAQSALVTEAGAVIQIVRKTTAPTVTSIAASTWLNHDNGADSVLTAGHTATVEGTAADLISFGWNTKAGWYWNPTPEEYIVCPSGTANGLSLKSNVAPSAGAYVFRMTVVELG